MSMADILPALRRGEVPVLRERHSSITKGHSSTEGGLRGHSVGESWPYRVVGKGDGTWEVHRNGCGQVLVGMTCRGAHRAAEQLAKGRLTWLLQ